MTKLDGVSSAAAEKATGHGWDAWLAILDRAGAEDWNHKQIVAFLKENHRLSGWWQQTVTVAYEKAKGRRVVGQTADAGFQVGVQKTLPIGVDEVWALLASRKGISCWLGKISRFKLGEGTRYETDCGTEGEIRVVKAGHRVRLTWQPTGLKSPATLQVTLVAGGPAKTSVRVHLEKLPSQKFREEIKEHWRRVLGSLCELATA